MSLVPPVRAGAGSAGSGGAGATLGAVTTAIQPPGVLKKHAARGHTHETRYDPQYGIRGRCSLGGAAVDWTDATGPVDCSDCLADALLAAIRGALGPLRLERGRAWSPWLLLGRDAFEHLVRSAVFSDHLVRSGPMPGPQADMLFGCRFEPVLTLIDPYGWMLVDPLDGKVLAR